MDGETNAFFLNVDIKETWLRSPISRDAIARIFSAPAGSMNGDPLEVEALYLTLARVTDWLMHAAFDGKKSPRKAREAVAHSLLRLIRSYNDVLGTSNPPPPPPDDWVKRMRGWIEAELVTKPASGRPKNEFEHFAYTALLAMYAYAFKRKPAPTVRGPTERFMMAYLREMHSTVSSMVVNPPHKAGLLTERWQLPTPDILRVRIRLYAPLYQENSAFPEYYWPRFLDALVAEQNAPSSRVH